MDWLLTVPLLLIEIVFLFRFGKKHDVMFLSLHDLQVRGCIAHLAHYSMHRYLASCNAPVVRTLVLLSAAGVAHAWA